MRPRTFGLLLILFIFAYCPEVVLGTKTLFFRDFGFFGYPLAAYHRDLFWKGEVALWNPFNCCGLPFLAQWNTLVLYPGSLIYLLLPLPWSLNLFCLAHQWLAGFGMYHLARRWTGDGYAAAVAGLAYGGGGLLLSSLMWPNNIAAFGWMPWLFLAMEGAWSQGGRWIAGAALVGALQMLTGAPEVILFTWLLLGALWISSRFALGWTAVRAWVREGGRWSAVVVLVVLLAAAQLWPFLELLGRSHRDEGDFVAEKGGWSIAVSGWGNLLVPLFRCQRLSQDLYLQIHQYWTPSYYLGVLGVLLAIFVIARSRAWRVRWLGLVSFLGLILAMGSAGYVQPWAERLIPPLALMRFQAKYVILVTFCIPLLAAYGLKEFLGMPAPPQRRVLVLGGITAALLFLMTALVCWTWYVPHPREEPRALVQSAISRAAFLVAAFGVLIRIARATQSVPRERWLLGLLLLSSVDLMTQMPRQHPVGDRSLLEPLLEATHQMDAVPRLGESRAAPSAPTLQKVFYKRLSNHANDFLISRLTAMVNANLIDRVPSPYGFFSLYLREMDQVKPLIFNTPDPLASPLFDFIGVSQITRPGTELEWMTRPSSGSWLSGGQRPVVAGPEETLRQLGAATFAPRDVVYLPPEASTVIEHPVSRDVRVIRQRVTEQRIQAEVEVEGEGSGWLVIAQTWYPAWTATIDRRPTTLWRANHAFQALQVPPGRHRVEVVYRDQRFRWGSALSLGTLAGVLAVVWRRRRVAVPHREEPGRDAPGLS